MISMMLKPAPKRCQLPCQVATVLSKFFSLENLLLLDLFVGPLWVLKGGAIPYSFLAQG